MKLLTLQDEARLISNHNQIHKATIVPVVKLFGGSSCTWLLSEYDPEDRLFFGLCDLGMGSPELGYVSRDELEAIRFPPFGLPVERDRHWTATKTLSEYATEAKAAGRINA